MLLTKSVLSSCDSAMPWVSCARARRRQLGTSERRQDGGRRDGPTYRVVLDDGRLGADADVGAAVVLEHDPPDAAVAFDDQQRPRAVLDEGARRGEAVHDDGRRVAIGHDGRRRRRQGLARLGEDRRQEADKAEDELLGHGGGRRGWAEGAERRGRW